MSFEITIAIRWPIDDGRCSIRPLFIVFGASGVSILSVLYAIFKGMAYRIAVACDAPLKYSSLSCRPCRSSRTRLPTPRSPAGCGICAVYVTVSEPPRNPMTNQPSDARAGRTAAFQNTAAGSTILAR